MKETLIHEDFDKSVRNLKRRSQWGDIWRRLTRNRLAMVGLAIVALLVLVAIFANVLAPYDPTYQDMTVRFQIPNSEHWLGTDQFGRDILSRMVYGGRISLLVSIMGCVFSLTIGAVIGACSGFFGGKVDFLVMRFMDILMAIPGILLAICISAMLGTGVWQTALAIAVGGIAPSCRMIRAQVLTIRDQEYIEAAVAGGSKNARIISRHIIPNCLAPLIVDTTLRLGINILLISGLSFIGLGVQPPLSEWGSMLNSGRQFIRDFYPLITFPGIAIMLAMFGFNVFGDGLRDAMDPKLKK